MKKKLLSMALALVMASAMAVPAFAVDGTEADAPTGTTGTTNPSTGMANTTSTDGTVWETANDDDALAQAADNNGADINVWAKVLDASTPTYKIDIAWGAMKFEYNSGEGKWNTGTHTYDGAGGTAAWTAAGYVDGTNNKITVTNHSNKAVDAAFAYAMNTTNPFNAAVNASSVVGNFFADNAKAVTASTVLDDTATVAEKLDPKGIALHTADTYYASATDKTNDTKTPVFDDANKISTGREKPVFFAFSGKPDKGVGVTLNTFQKVGVITVTVAPKTILTDFEF